MTDALIAPEGLDWPSLDHLPTEIEAWEQANQVTLPATYRAFLLSYNGGRIFPSLFEVRQPAEVWGLTDFETFCDPLYDWNYAVTLWNDARTVDTTPENMFFIGCTPGGLEILLSLRPADHGSIFTGWNGGNSAFYLQASDFAGFIGQMYETSDGTAMDYWTSPRHQNLARPLTLE